MPFLILYVVSSVIVLFCAIQYHKYEKTNFDQYDMFSIFCPVLNTFAALFLIFHFVEAIIRGE